MTKSEKEMAIIKVAIQIPKMYGDYKLIDSLERGIARVMGYEIYTFRNRQWSFKNDEERKNTNTIIQKMEERKIIKMSKSGQAFKLLKAE